MTKAPTIPRSNRNLADLDALINQSIGTEVIDTAPVRPQADPDKDASGKAPSNASPIADERPSGSNARERSSPTKLERLQVKVSDDVLLALKFEALRQKRSPTAIVELALRQYLNPRNDA